MRSTAKKPLVSSTIRPFGIRTRALVLIAAVALLTVSLGAGVTSADGRGEHGTAENTFTKWVTAFPNVAGDVADMAGVVGGDVGKGTFAGEVLKRTQGTTTTPTVIEALYHFNGSRHSFTALVHVVQTGLKAVIIGVVTEGWLKGDQVEGKYTQTTCPRSPAAGNTCFKGTLDLMRGSGD